MFPRRGIIAFVGSIVFRIAIQGSLAQHCSWMFRISWSTTTGRWAGSRASKSSRYWRTRRLRTLRKYRCWKNFPLERKFLGLVQSIDARPCSFDSAMRSLVIITRSLVSPNPLALLLG
uniref:RxLR effector candidate protein n=1 Tax=Hyaloperonospora arabidopsidis (strain Emoy2) TaxID=559515 RepID=M4B9L1_HYAAE